MKKERLPGCLWLLQFAPKKIAGSGLMTTAFRRGPLHAYGTPSNQWGSRVKKSLSPSDRLLGLSQFLKTMDLSLLKAAFLTNAFLIIQEFHFIFSSLLIKSLVRFIAVSLYVNSDGLGSPIPKITNFEI